MLSQADIDELETDPDPVAVVSARVTEYLFKCATGPCATPPPIYSTLDNNIKGLNADLGACQRILSMHLFPPICKIDLLHVHHVAFRHCSDLDSALFAFLHFWDLFGLPANCSNITNCGGQVHQSWYTP